MRNQRIVQGAILNERAKIDDQAERADMAGLEPGPILSSIFRAAGEDPERKALRARVQVAMLSLHGMMDRGATATAALDYLTRAGWDPSQAAQILRAFLNIRATL